MHKYIIQTPRLGLRKWTEEDLIPFSKMNTDPNVMEFFPNTLTLEESTSMIDRINTHFDTHGFGLYAVELLENNKFIGFIGLSVPSFQAEFTPCVEIGWRLAYEFWGNGYAAEGAQACLNYGFNSLGLSEIVSFTAALNKRSMRVMEKLNMNYCGEFFHPKLDVNHPLCKHVLYKTFCDKTSSSKFYTPGV